MTRSKKKGLKKEFNNIENDYIKCVNGQVTLIVNNDEFSRMESSNELRYEPRYKTITKKTTINKYDLEAKNKTYHDLSELKSLIVSEEIDTNKTEQVVLNQSVLDFMLKAPIEYLFEIYNKQSKKTCFAIFVESGALRYKQNNYIRKIKFIGKNNIVNNNGVKTVRNLSKIKKTLPKEKKRKKKDKKPKMTYLGSKKVGEKVGNKIIYSFENATPRSTHCSDFDKQISAPIITKHLDLLSGAGGLNDYHEYSMNDNRIVYTSTRNNDAFVLLEENNIAQNIQLIKSSRNHVTMHHDVRNVNAKMIVYDKTIKAFRRMNMAVHYCNKCHKYFDYYESFTHQLSQSNIPITNILINYFDDNDEYIQFDTYNLKEHSRLSLLGYSVGQSGLSRFKRQFLIDKIIDKKLMTASQIKNHLEFLIRFHGRKSNMKNAVSSWEEDIDYINECIVNGKYL